jgi:hypothetical protein
VASLAHFRICSNKMLSLREVALTKL